MIVNRIENGCRRASANDENSNAVSKEIQILLEYLAREQLSENKQVIDTS